MSVIQASAPVRFKMPSRISIKPTENSIVRPRRVGIAMPSKIMEAPTIKIVTVWPTPQSAPMRPAFTIERSRLTIVETAMT